MPAHTVTIPVAADARRVWQHVHVYENWADLFPGYQGHRTVAGGRSVWTIKGDIGMFSRLVDIEVAVVEEVENELVKFTIGGVTENLHGVGTFQVGAAVSGAIELTFAVDVQPDGPMAPLVNSLLKARLPRMMEQFARALVERIVSRQPSTPTTAA